MDGYDLQSIMYVALGAVAGLAGGWLFHRIWRRILPRSHGRAYWQALGADIRGMLQSPEPADLLRHYRKLLAATASFGGRNLLGVLAGIAPAAVLFVLFDAYDLPGRIASEIEAYPAPIRERLAGPAEVMRVHEGRLLIDRAKLHDSSLLLAGVTLNREELAGKQAICKTLVSCLIFDALLFKTHQLRAGVDGNDYAPVIFRPRMIDKNPIWPYLNDLEFWFFVAVMVGSAVAAWGRPARKG